MLSLVYASSTTEFLNDQALSELLQVSRTNNAKLDITGLLLYKDGNVIQALEGPDESVRALYEKIKRDPRHNGIIKLVEETITERRFPNWSMGFQSVKRLPIDMPGFNPFLTDSSLVEVFQRNPTKVYVLLMAFRDSVR
jgi:lipopolysaccharide biosynthesis regulator YciM